MSQCLSVTFSYHIIRWEGSLCPVKVIHQWSGGGGDWGQQRRNIYLIIPKSTLIENLICKTFSKVSFYSTVHTMYVHTFKNVKKVVLNGLPKKKSKVSSVFRALWKTHSFSLVLQQNITGLLLLQINIIYMCTYSQLLTEAAKQKQASSSK